MDNQAKDLKLEKDKKRLSKTRKEKSVRGIISTWILRSQAPQWLISFIV